VFLSVSDLNNDGKPDVVVSNFASPSISVIENTSSNGTTSFQSKVDYTMDNFARSSAAGDLDGDGKGEIIALGERRNSLGGDVRIYQHTVKGWRGATVARDIQSIALGPFSTRGKRELVVSGKENQLIELDLRRIQWDASLGEETETYQIDAATLIDKPTPRLQADEWIGSEPLTMEKLKGKVVVLDFWATWCVPCIKQFPTLRQWQEKYGPRGLVIIGVTNLSNQTSQDVRAFTAKELTISCAPERCRERFNQPKREHDLNLVIVTLSAIESVIASPSFFRSSLR